MENEGMKYEPKFIGNKAGTEGIDKKKIALIIHNLSGKSHFYKRK